MLPSRQSPVMTNSSSHHFLQRLPEHMRETLGGPEGEAKVDALLEALFDRARSTWPRLAVSREDFAAYLAERLVEGPVEVLESLRTEELYLACACAQQCNEALAIISSSYMPAVTSVLQSMKLGQPFVEDVVQEVWQKLFVASTDERARICDYGGHGELGVWMRVIAVRTALSRLRKGKRERAFDDDAMLVLADPHDDPELALMKRTYRAELKIAFREAVESLEVRERNLLRMHLLDGLSIDRVGALYRVNRTTAYRWIAKAREKVWQKTQKILSAKLELRPSEVRSIVRQVQSQLDLSIERALGEG